MQNNGRMFTLSQQILCKNNSDLWTNKMIINVQNIRILIVDDYKTMLRIIDNLLRQIGFQHIDQAIDGLSALDKLTTTQYDLIISDWTMSPMSGLELLKDVRSNIYLHNIPFLMVTGETHIDTVTKAQSIGMNDYIVKPFNAAMLKDKLVCILGKF